jgi:hypothetical protein
MVVIAQLPQAGASARRGDARNGAGRRPHVRVRKDPAIDERHHSLAQAVLQLIGAPPPA